MSIKSVPIFTQVMDRPVRKLILRCGEKASHYFDYCDEVCCDVWGILTSIKEALYEPVGMWLPKSLRAGKFEYVQGVEVPIDFKKILLEGFEIITLELQLYMVYQSPKYEDVEFMKTIHEFNQAVDAFDPTLYGYEYDFERAPKFQLEPRGERGYIETKPVVN